MNKYRDLFLDDQGVAKLDQIIEMSHEHPLEALTLLDELIQSHPYSPQLWVSKSIITPSKYNEARIEYCKEAIDLDKGFFEGYYYLAKNQLLGTTVYCSCGVPSERLEAGMQIFDWMKRMRQDAKAGLEELQRSPHFFVENWNDWYEAALANEKQGLMNLDRNRYTQIEVDKLVGKHNLCSNINPTARKIIVMHELAQSLGVSFG